MNIKIFSLLNKKKKFELKLIFFLSSIYFFLEFASLSSIPVFVGILINPELILTKLENLTNLEIIETYSKSNYQIFFAALVIFLFIIKNLYLVLITIYESSFLQRFKISISNKLFNFYAKLSYSYHLKNNPVKLTKMVSDEIQNISGYIKHLLTFIREILALIVIFFSGISDFTIGNKSKSFKNVLFSILGVALNHPFNTLDAICLKSY